MCIGAPAAPPPVPQRQAAKSPDPGLVAAQTSAEAQRRMGFAATILTPSSMTSSSLAPTTGKALLGS